MPALPGRPADRVRQDRGVRRRARRPATTTDARRQSTIAYSKRADGTWLIRAKGTVDGRYYARRPRLHGRRPEVRPLGRRGREGRPPRRQGRGEQAPQALAASGDRAPPRPPSPRALGWNGAAALPGTSGSTQRVPEPTCTRPGRARGRVGVDDRRAVRARLLGEHRVQRDLDAAQVGHVGPRDRHLRPAARAAGREDRRVVDDQDPRRRARAGGCPASTAATFGAVAVIRLRSSSTPLRT